MRRFAQRPNISEATQQRLQAKTLEILAVAEGNSRKTKAREIYDASRQTQWFTPILTALRSLCGAGELCMYCSSNEPSQVEHFRPLNEFPEDALSYDNYLWSCDICNRSYKGEKFPPHNHAGAPILNPLDDNVWDHFFVDDQFGRLLPRIDPATNQRLPRAISTCEVVGIDRENVQIKRSRIYKTLLRDVQNALTNFLPETTGILMLQGEIARLRSEPFQADVADYFLNGPGREKEPFRTLLLVAGDAASEMFSSV